MIGFGVLEDESEDNPSGFGTGGWREGRALIERELQSRSEGGGAVGLASRGESLDLERRAGAVAGHVDSTSKGAEGAAASNACPSSKSPIQLHHQPWRNKKKMMERDTSIKISQSGYGIRSTARIRPEWLRNLGSGIKTPKWMQNESERRQRWVFNIEVVRR